LGGQVIGDAPQHGCGRARQSGTLIGLAHVGQLDSVGMNVEELTPTPGVKDIGWKNVLID
jgi:hypothetical protein